MAYAVQGVFHTCMLERSTRSAHIGHIMFFVEHKGDGFMTTQMRHCVRAAQRGDKLAAEELLQAFMPLLQHQARRYQPYYQNFEEAFSTACHGAIHCIFQYDLEQTETVAKMMVASVHNHLRRESYQKQCYDKRIEKNIIENNTVTDLPEAALASEGACPEQCCLQNEMKWQMTKAMEQLPDMHYRIIWRHFFQGDSYQKIAEEYHISKSTVRDYVKRSLARMKHYLTEEKMVI